jgi:hypothetical protein
MHVIWFLFIEVDSGKLPDPHHDVWCQTYNEYRKRHLEEGHREWFERYRF